MKHCLKGFMNVFYLKIQTTLLVMCCYSEVIEQETLECLVISPRLFIQIFWVQIFCAECERCRDGLETRLDFNVYERMKSRRVGANPLRKGQGGFWEEVMSKQEHRGSIGVCGNEKKFSLANINVFVNMCI